MEDKEETIFFEKNNENLTKAEQLKSCFEIILYNLLLLFYKKVKKSSSRIAECYEKLFRLYCKLKSYKKTITLFDNILNYKVLKDIDKKVLVVISGIYLHTNNYDKVIDVSKKTLALEDIDSYKEEKVSILGSMALAYAYKNEFDLALDYANELINYTKDNQKENTKGILLLAHVYFNKREYNLALSYLYKALEFGPEHQISIYTLLILIFDDIDKFELAKAAKEIRNSLKNHSGKYSTSARNLFNMALQNRYLGFKTQQRVFFDIAIHYLKRIEESNLTKKDLIRININDHDINMYLVELYCEKYEIDKAIYYLKQLLNMKLNESILRNFLGYLPFLYYKKKDYQMSVQELNILIKKYPNESVLYYYLSLNNFELNDLEQALINIEKAISLDAISAEYYHCFGKILLAKGEFKEAQEKFDISIKFLIMSNL